MSQDCVGRIEARLLLLSRYWDKNIPRLGKVDFYKEKEHVPPTA